MRLCEHAFVYAVQIKERWLVLIRAGLNDCEISRRLGSPGPRFVTAECPRTPAPEYRRYAGQVRIYRRASVARMLQHVGIKD